MFFLRIFEIDDVIVALTTGCATMEAHVSCVEFRGSRLLCPWFFFYGDVIVAITTLGATMVAHVSCVEFHGESFDGSYTKRIRP